MIRILLMALFLVGFSAPAQAFCGFYVAKADGSLYNEASKVVFTRNGRQSVITISSDYRGAARDFAMIVPTPKVLRRNQIRTVDAKTVQHLDDYTAPRLVEYHDYDPCEPLVEPMMEAAPGDDSAAQRRRGAKALGVTIKAEYAVGNYDIAILKAQQSDGLITFLTQEGYKLPPGADTVLGGYIGMGMKFFVAKVNLSRHSASKAKELPPLQLSFRSRNFMLPIQLGKLNADTAQDALFLMLSKKGRVEVANYNVKALPSDVDVPVFVEKVFGQFYKAVFARTLGSGGGIVMEYAWDMAWCDPCAADPLSRTELEELGVTWLKPGENAAQDVYVTRLHAQYTKTQMPNDLIFRETRNRENFQGRYVMHHPFKGNVNCEAGQYYVSETRKRIRDEAKALAQLTGWSMSSIEKNIRKTVPKRYR